VIELDGIQHYADDNQRADPWRYGQMVADDRALQLAGYEVHRFGGHELAGRQQAVRLFDSFFARTAGHRSVHRPWLVTGR
jgi:very-short-patch-repair endonuclease